MMVKDIFPLFRINNNSVSFGSHKQDFFFPQKKKKKPIISKNHAFAEKSIVDLYKKSFFGSF